ncbi:MAG: P-loop NTPase [Promethearchaeota archaeon]
MTRQKIIGVSGGKGGTGKSFVAVNLAMLLSKQYRVLLVDTDVDNPNTSILLGIDLPEPDDVITCFMPRIDEQACMKCGKCAKNCRFHALFHLEGKIPTLIEPLCTSCELCMKICPHQAIDSMQKEIGERFFMKVNENLDLLVGRLFPGSAKTTMVIIALKEYMERELLEHEKYDYIIVDSAPGAHCDVEHSLEGTDVVLLVTEPTPLGRHDLGRIIELVNFIGKEAKVIMNRSDMAGDATGPEGGFELFAKDHGTELISKIPLSKDVMETYARGEPITMQEERFGRDHPVIKEFYSIMEVVK